MTHMMEIRVDTHLQNEGMIAVSGQDEAKTVSNKQGMIKLI